MGHVPDRRLIMIRIPTGTMERIPSAWRLSRKMRGFERSSCSSQPSCSEMSSISTTRHN